MIDNARRREDLSSVFISFLPSGFFRVVPQYGKKESLQPLPDRDADDWCQVNVKWDHPELYFIPDSITEIVRAPHLAWITSYYKNRFVGFPMLSIEVWYSYHPSAILNY